MTNMHTIINTLLTNSTKVIERLTSEYAEAFDVDGYDENKEQWVVSNFDYMLSYTDENGFIFEVYMISKDNTGTWYVQTDDADIMIELPEKSFASELTLFKQIPFKFD